MAISVALNQPTTRDTIDKTKAAHICAMLIDKTTFYFLNYLLSFMLVSFHSWWNLNTKEFIQWMLIRKRQLCSFLSNPRNMPTIYISPRMRSCFFAANQWQANIAWVYVIKYLHYLLEWVTVWQPNEIYCHSMSRPLEYSVIQCTSNIPVVTLS